MLFNLRTAQIQWYKKHTKYMLFVYWTLNPKPIGAYFPFRELYWKAYCMTSWNPMCTGRVLGNHKISPKVILAWQDTRRRLLICPELGEDRVCCSFCSSYSRAFCKKLHKTRNGGLQQFRVSMRITALEGGVVMRPPSCSNLGSRSLRHALLNSKSLPRPSFYPLLGPKYPLLGTIYPNVRVQGGS